MRAVEVPRHRWTRDDYALLYESELRCELIEGEIVDMSPMKPRHALVVNRLAHLLNRLLDPLDFTVGIQTPVVLSEISEPEPDIWVAHLSFRTFADRKPEPGDLSLIIEVADSTLRFDRDVKVPMYATARVAIVWLIDLTTDVVTEYGEPDNGTYRLERTALRGESIPLPWGGELSVAELLLLDANQ